MADEFSKLSLRARRKLIIDSVINTLSEANELYFNPVNDDDADYALRTMNFCKSILLRDMNF